MDLRSIRNMHLLASSLACLGILTIPVLHAFVPARPFVPMRQHQLVTPSSSSSTTTRLSSTLAERAIVGVGTKPSGTSFLPDETVERAQNGSPIEKIKLEKDGTAAFVDVYEYARKIREGEMTWEEVEKADLDNVSRNMEKTCLTRAREGLISRFFWILFSTSFSLNSSDSNGSACCIVANEHLVNS